ncbi:MAG: hypothetical protein EXS17_08040 [Phycisphaerales bacterium]|nr:hypothetical protein [Phycisphaerales bacterium]
MFCLRTSHGQRLASPVHITPLKPNQLRGATKAGVAGETNNGTPVRARALFEHLSNHLARHIDASIRIHLRAVSQMIEGVGLDEPESHGLAEDRLGDNRSLRNGRSR